MSSAPDARPTVRRCSTSARRSSLTSTTTRWKTSAASIWCSMSSAATSRSGPHASFEPEAHWCPLSGRPRRGPSTASRSTSLSSPIVPSWVRSSSECGTDDCGRTSATSRPSMTLSPPSTRPSDARARRSSAFVRERHAPIDAVAGRRWTRSCRRPGRAKRSSAGWPATSGGRSSSGSTIPRRCPEGCGRPFKRSTLTIRSFPTSQESAMNRTFLALAVSAAVGIGGMALARHDERGGAKVTDLSRRDIVEKLDGKDARVTVEEVEIEPGGRVAPHRHAGPVFGYVLEGEYEHALDDDPVATYKAGDTFYEPTGCVHRVTRNPSASARTRLLAVILHPRNAREVTIPEKAKKE